MLKQTSPLNFLDDYKPDPNTTVVDADVVAQLAQSSTIEKKELAIDTDIEAKKDTTATTERAETGTHYFHD